jgi:hypothetical protein
VRRRRKKGEEERKGGGRVPAVWISSYSPYAPKSHVSGENRPLGRAFPTCQAPESGSEEAAKPLLSLDQTTSLS